MLVFVVSQFLGVYNEGRDEIVKDEKGTPILIGGKQVTSEEAVRGFSTVGVLDMIESVHPNFPMSKLSIGAAAYGRGWEYIKVKKAHDKLFWHGLAQQYTGGDKDGLGVAGSFQAGVTDFREIYDQYWMNGSAEVYYDKQAGAAYTWSEQSDSDSTHTYASVVSFDSPRSVIEKG